MHTSLTIFALLAGFQLPNDIGNTGNQNHLEVRVVLVTCISNIDFMSWKPADNAKMVNVYVHENACTQEDRFIF